MSSHKRRKERSGLATHIKAADPDQVAAKVVSKRSNDNPSKATNSTNSKPKPKANVPAAGSRSRKLVDDFGTLSLSGNLKVSVYEAAAHGTVQILAPLLRQFLARGKTMDSTGGRNRTTMLHEAAYNDNCDTLKLLLREGASTNARDKAGATPLQMAAFNGATSCVQALLEAKADISAADNQGTTPLHAAAISGNLSNVRLLVKYKADVMSRDRFRATPLHYSALHGQGEVAQYLIRKGANVNAVDEEGLAPLHMALEDGHDAVVQLLLAAGAQPDVTSVAGQTPLHHAAERNRVKSVDALLLHEASLSAVDAAGSTPLHLAAFHGAVDVLQVLLAAGAPVDAGRTPPSKPAPVPSHRMSRKMAPLNTDDGNDSATEEMDAAVGTNGTAMSDDDDDDDEAVTVYDTPLHHAAHQGRVACLQLLLTAGANVNAKDAAGATALHKACFNEHVECAAALLKAGADVAAADVEGSTALHRAAHNGNAACVRLLLKHNARADAVDVSMGTPLHNAAYAGRKEAAAALLEGNAKVDPQDEVGNTPLHLAMHQSKKDVGKLLLSKGASSQKKNNKGMLPLHYAVNDPACLKMLLDRKGVNVDAKDDRGRAPLFYAVRAANEDSVRLLIRRDADVNSMDNKGKKALEASTTLSKRWLSRLLRERNDAARSEAARRFRRAVPQFNEHPKKGIKWAIDEKVITSGDAEHIAEFLHVAEDLNKVALGGYIAGKDEHQALVRQAFMKRLDFNGMHVAEALRDLLTRFRLPGEAQQIDRVMESFARRYHESNPGKFSHEDTCYVLSVAIIMLNTDAHNPNIKPDKKMTLEQWFRNCRGIDQGKDLPREYLEELYSDILEDELKMNTNSVSQATHKGFLTKQGGRIKTWKTRYFVVSDSCLYYFKNQREKEPLGIIPLENVDVRPSKKKKYCFELWQTDNNTMKAAKVKSDGSIERGHHDSYALAASTESSMREWIDAIERSVCANPFQRLIQQRLAVSHLNDANATTPVAVAALEHIDFAAAYKHVGMCRLASKPEAYLRKKFGAATVVVHRRHLSAYMTVDRDAKRQYIVVCPEDAAALRRVQRAWSADYDDAEESDSASMSTATPTRKVLTPKSSPAQKVSDTTVYANDGSTGVGDVSAEEIQSRVLNLLDIDASVDELYDCIAPALDRELFITIIGYSIACAVSTNLALRLKDSRFRLRMVQNFGAPRFVTNEEVTRFSGLPITRLRVVDDPVPLELFPGMRAVGVPVILLKGQYYCQLTDPQGDVEELACLQQDARPLNDAQHHLDEYAESVRIKMKKRTELNYRSPDRLKHSIN